jgi:hypothetical protein
MPVWSLVEVPVRPSVSGAPGVEVMTRNSPDTTSKRTVRLASGKPDWLSCTRTSASPPAQTAVPHAADWLELGVTVTTLLTVRAFTVSTAVTGTALPVSRTVSVTGVSPETGPATTVSSWPVTRFTTGNASWSLEVATYVPVPPVMRKLKGESVYSVPVPGVTVSVVLPAGGWSATAPLPQDDSTASAPSARTTRAKMPGRADAKAVTKLPDFDCCRPAIVAAH